MVWVVSLSTMDLITHCLTPIHHIYGIRSLSEFGNPGWAPRPNSALPPRCLYEAIPKYISERTSYLQVRLEFLRYPHVIQTFFNMSWFGPPVRLTAPSTCTWVGHLVSGRRHLTYALFRLAFATAPLLQLNLANYRHSPVHSTKGTPSPINGL